MQNWCMHQNSYVMPPISFKRQQKRKETLDDRMCSSGSDIESQDLFNNVSPGHDQSRLSHMVSLVRYGT